MVVRFPFSSEWRAEVVGKFPKDSDSMMTLITPQLAGFIRDNIK